MYSTKSCSKQQYSSSGISKTKYQEKKNPKCLKCVLFGPIMIYQFDLLCIIKHQKSLGFVFHYTCIHELKKVLGITYDIVWAIAPATPPHSRLMWVFRTRTSGLSRDGFPRSSGKWASPRLFSVPNVKNENPGRNQKYSAHITYIGKGHHQQDHI